MTHYCDSAAVCVEVCGDHSRTKHKEDTDIFDLAPGRWIFAEALRKGSQARRLPSNPLRRRQICVPFALQLSCFC